MNQLQIGNTTYDIKFNHRFYDNIITDFAKKHKNSNSNGFNNLIQGLIDEDPDAIITAYRAAIEDKHKPTVSEVSAALDDAGVFDDKDAYSKVFKEIKSSGFLAGKIRHLLKLMYNDWKNSEEGLKVVMENSDKSDKDYKNDVRQAKMETAIAKKAYELMKKILEELGK